MPLKEIRKDIYDVDAWIDEGLGAVGTSQRDKAMEEAWDEYNARTATSKIFKECMEEVPEELKLEIGWSDAIAQKIINRLSELGLSQKDFAKEVGKTEDEVSNWLSGTHNFTLRTLSKISKVLNVDIIQIGQ